MLEADPTFATALEPRVRAVPCFRPPTDREVDVAYEAYRDGDAAALCRAWREVASPVRAVLPFPSSVAYPRLGLLPRAVNGSSFLITVRAALRAGVRFRDGLSEPTRRAIAEDFPWLERRHEHIPAGYTPDFDFPDVFAAFVDVPDLDEARARWQLCAVVNEVQQAAYSRSAAALFRLPELVRHAEREEALAACYAAHWSPACTRELWRQCLLVLDALNAALFHWVTSGNTAGLMARSAWAAATGATEWRAFVAALDTPQVLLPPGSRPAWRERL
jgi:hypothetical protein